MPSACSGGCATRAMTRVSPADIADFLRSVGLEVRAAELPPDECFLPGIRLDRGAVLYDVAALTWPGGLLHEAGHVAVAPPGARPLFTGAADVPGLDMGRLEHAAVAWSYAAALAAGVDPAARLPQGGHPRPGPPVPPPVPPPR